MSESLATESVAVVGVDVDGSYYHLDAQGLCSTGASLCWMYSSGELALSLTRPCTSMRQHNGAGPGGWGKGEPAPRIEQGRAGPATHGCEVARVLG